MFVPLLVMIYNWMNQGTILQCFTRGRLKLRSKDKYGGNGISNFHPLTILNTDLKILADCSGPNQTRQSNLQTVL